MSLSWGAAASLTAVLLAPQRFRIGIATGATVALGTLAVIRKARRSAEVEHKPSAEIIDFQSAVVLDALNPDALLEAAAVLAPSAVIEEALIERIADAKDTDEMIIAAEAKAPEASETNVRSHAGRRHKRKRA